MKKIESLNTELSDSVWNHRFAQNSDRFSSVKKNQISVNYQKQLVNEISTGRIRTERVTTCQCGDVNFIKLADFDRFGIPLGSIICKKCGLINCSPRISENSLKEYYKTFYHPIHFGVTDFENKEARFKKGTGNKIWSKLPKF